MKSLAWLFYIGMFLVLSIYHFMVYLGRKKDRNNLYYSLLGITSIIWLFSKTLFRLFCNSLIIYTSFIYISISLVALSIAIFTYYTLELKKIKKYILFGFPILFVIPVLIAILVLIITNKKGFSDIIVIIPGTIFGIIYWILASYLFFVSKYSKDKWRLYIYISISLYYVFYIAYPILIILKFNEIIQVLVATTGVLIMLIMSAYSLTKSFNQEHKDLINLKNTLEQKVRQRTQELEKANTKIKQSE